jgi:hypothetical protein
VTSSSPQAAGRDVEAGARGDRPSARAPVVAVVKDLFFVARIRETARLAGVALQPARSTEDVERIDLPAARLVLLDLTGGFDYDRVFRALARAPGVPVLGFTTHALARQTRPWHARCGRVVTKETLTQELPALLRDGLAP